MGGGPSQWEHDSGLGLHAQGLTSVRASLGNVWSLWQIHRGEAIEPEAQRQKVTYLNCKNHGPLWIVKPMPKTKMALKSALLTPTPTHTLVEGGGYGESSVDWNSGILLP